MREKVEAVRDSATREAVPGASLTRIVVLDAATANQIAAGEVVERPGSVVKELVENSLDAVARHIAVEVKGGGLELIRVRDDGQGIYPEDVPLAFARHATSKIRRVSDLLALNTLGFRGEALPSIAAVARVEMDTRPAGEMAGTRVRIAGGGAPEVTTTGCPPGTTVTVCDLFYNTPARRQYLKKPATETRAIVAVVARLALAHPQVALSLQIEGRRVLATPGNADWQAVVTAVYGLETGREMLPLAGEGAGWSLQGFISPPWLHRANRSQQVLIVNGRYILNHALTWAVENCYQAVIPAGRHPLFMLQLAIDPYLVDVNVHPAKMEVRFQQESDLVKGVAGLVNRALHTPKAVPPVKAGIPVRQQGFNFPVKEKEAGFWGEYILREKPAAQPDQTSGQPDGSLQPEKEGREAVPLPGGEQLLPPLRAIGQLFNTYILAEGRDGLYIIDQHAAHERCRFESLQEKINSGSRPPAQMLDPPVTLHLAPDLAVKLVDQIVTLRELGFIVESFGSSSFLLRSVPLGIPPGQERNVLEDFLAVDSMPAPERMLKLIACHGAIKAGQPLDRLEIQSLLAEIQGLRRPFTCPHGRPAVVRLDPNTLARYFHRPPADKNLPG
ncbi:MAG: mismatch repair protein MutL [Clostridia bacterium]|nr:mismatch repair protein MutL [Clostridia bacterium]